jgi:hypothetical protein
VTVPLKPRQTMPAWTTQLVRASADGKAYLFHDGYETQTHNLILLNLADGYGEVSGKPYFTGYAVPGTDRNIYTSMGVITDKLTPVLPRDGFKPNHWFLPAAHGPFFQRVWYPLDPTGAARNRKEKAAVTFHVGNDGTELARLEGVDGLDEPTNAPPFGRLLMLDKRLHVIPDAKLLITLPPAYDRLILRRCDIDQLLAQSGKDYLFVTSRPPAESARGKRYNYPLAVRSKRGGVKVKLESGPMGMTVSKDWEIAWDVPANSTESQVQVILAITDSSGQELFHTFRIAVQP